MRLLDEVLKLAKLRSSDPKKYLPIAVNMLKDRLKQSSSTRTRKQGVRFAHTLETIFTATDDEPELITAFLKSKTEKKPKTSTATDLDLSVPKMTGAVHHETDVELVKSITDPIVEEVISPTDIGSVESNKYHPETVLSTSLVSQIGLTMAQLIVLITVQNQEPLKLTNGQIRQ